jgi:hypothetical protein
MGYAEAIEQQVALADYWASPASKDDALSVHEFLGGPGSTPHMQRVSIVSVLLHARPFYVAPPICAVLAEAARSIPEATLTRDLLPEMAGYLHFATPVPIPTPDATALRAYARERGYSERDVTRIGGYPQGLRAVSWQLAADGETVLAYFYTDFLDQQRPYPHLMWAIGWRFGHHLGMLHFHDDDDAVERAAKPMMGRLWLAFLLFVQQRKLVLSSQPVLNHGARKRLARVLEWEPLVHVVQLRRLQSASGERSDAASFEYSCQWLVRGHWRNQYFPASATHRPIWVNPHVKGPGDKPFRAAPATVYEVVR